MANTIGYQKWVLAVWTSRSSSHMSDCHLTSREVELAWELLGNLILWLWGSKSVSSAETDNLQVNVAVVPLGNCYLLWTTVWALLFPQLSRIHDVCPVALGHMKISWLALGIMKVGHICVTGLLITVDQQLTGDFQNWTYCSFNAIVVTAYISLAFTFSS